MRSPPGPRPSRSADVLRARSGAAILPFSLESANVNAPPPRGSQSQEEPSTPPTETDLSLSLPLVGSLALALGSARASQEGAAQPCFFIRLFYAFTSRAVRGG